MSIIAAENVTQAYGAQVVLAEVSFRLGQTDRVGIVGPNGEGKTTLLRIAGGLAEPTSGRITRRRDLRVGLLPQDPPALSGTTVHGAMLEIFTERRALEKQLHELAVRLGEDRDDDLLARYGQVQTRFEAMGGYDYSVRIERVLTGLGFGPELRDRPLDQLSGGQRTRAYLAGLLLQQPDVLMLDEPTNHLDLDAVEWLESWLTEFAGCLLVVSHDRYLLDAVTRDTWEVAAGRLETYRGSYSRYVTKRAHRREERRRRWRAQQEYVARTEDFVRRNLAGQRTREAQGRRRRLERFLRDEAIDAPDAEQTISLDLGEIRRAGDIVLRAENLVIGYDASAPLIRAERLEVFRGQRVSVVGPNGAGKTTLLRTLLGELDPLGGSIETGANVSPGSLSQTHAELPADRSAVAAVMEAGCREQRARDLLGALLLGGEDAYKRIDQLSGGQRTRVALARLVVRAPNLMLLDEPTNHLDIPSTEIVQQVLSDYAGTVVFVSHDRYLIEALATHLWILDRDPGADPTEPGQVRAILGGWEEYRTWRASAGEASAQTDPSKEDRKAAFRRARQRSNQLQRLQRRHEELEGLIDQAETELARLNEEISAAGEAGQLERVEALGREYQQRDRQLRALWEEWEQTGLELEGGGPA